MSGDGKDSHPAGPAPEEPLPAPEASSQLFVELYDELRRAAHRQLRRESPGLTLQPTALVHEAFLRLGGGKTDWDSDAHFFGAAALAMRRILVERARRASRLKHGRGYARVGLDGVTLAESEETDAIDLIALDQALEELEHLDPRKHQVVQLRFFAGLTVEETARLLELSVATIKIKKQFARAWLYRRLETPEGEN